MFNLFRKSTTKSIMPTVQIPTTPVIRSPFINNTNNNNNSSGGNTTTGNTVGNESSSSSISSTVNQSITNQTDNYITTNRFYVEMESTLTASFSECSGFGVNLKKESYLEGGVNEQQRLVVGHAEFDDVTLKKGMSNSQLFWEWINNILNDIVVPVERLQEHFAHYLQLQKAHMLNENHHLFPLAERQLAEEDWVGIAAEMARHTDPMFEQNLGKYAALYEFVTTAD